MKAAVLSTMSMLDESTCYSPLNNTSRTIRLLLLSPALHQDDRTLQCDLKPVCLDDWPVYNALSYAWGENDDLGLQIRVRGVLVGAAESVERLELLASQSQEELVGWCSVHQSKRCPWAKPSSQLYGNYLRKCVCRPCVAWISKGASWRLWRSKFRYTSPR